MTEDERRGLYITWRSHWLKDQGIKLVLSPETLLDCDGFSALGWFDCEAEELWVATGGNPGGWFKVFVHECCHVDQWASKSKVWENCFIDGDDVGHDFDAWIHGSCDLTSSQIYDYSRRLQAVELDCEMRAAHQIVTYNLPIDLDLYIKQANAYILSYNLFCIFGRYHNKGTSVSTVPEIYKTLPDSFLEDYDATPLDYLLSAYDHCFKE